VEGKWKGSGQEGKGRRKRKGRGEEERGEEERERERERERSLKKERRKNYQTKQWKERHKIILLLVVDGQKMIVCLFLKPIMLVFQPVQT